VPPRPAESVGPVEDDEVVAAFGQLDAHRDAAGTRADHADGGLRRH